MNKFLFLTLGIFSVLMFTSCTKEIEKSKTKTDLLTQKPWVVEKLEEKVGSGPWIDDFPNMEACNKDDQFVFRTNNTFEFNEGPTKCDPSDPQIFGAGAWRFKNNETIIDLDDEEFTIEQLTETNFTISAQETFGSIISQVKITFRH